MTVRLLWTLERPDQPVKSGLDTVKDLTAILVAEDLPGVMPADRVMATLAMEKTLMEPPSSVFAGVDPFRKARADLRPEAFLIIAATVIIESLPDLLEGWEQRDISVS